MLAIARTALKATKLERNGMKVAHKAVHLCPPQQRAGLMMMTVEDIKSIEDVLNKKIYAYSKNIFKRIITWGKTFKDNYNLIKATVKSAIQTEKENYGELFTKKRQKHVKNLIINGTNEKLSELKDLYVTPLKNIIEHFKK